MKTFKVTLRTNQGNHAMWVKARNLVEAVSTFAAMVPRAGEDGPITAGLTDVDLAELISRQFGFGQVFVAEHMVYVGPVGVVEGFPGDSILERPNSIFDEKQLEFANQAIDAHERNRWR